MNNMQQRAAELFEDGQTVVVAVSGGADSMTLLHCLNNCGKKLSIIVAHLNHKLRGEESERDQKFVMDYCRKNHLLCVVKKVDVFHLAKKAHISTEQCGREQRYRFFESLCPQGGLIATAHTLSDQAETILFRLARGSHMNGLCGIPEKRGNIVRPLLHFSRSQVEAYCSEYSLPYIQDSTNFISITPRNQIRMEVTPVLKKINPKFENHLGLFIKHLSMDEDYLQTEAQRAYKTLYHHEKGLFIQSNWASLHTSLQSRILTYMLKDNGVPVSDLVIEKLLILTKKGGSWQLPNKKTAIASKEGFLNIFENEPETKFFCYPVLMGETKTFNNLQNLKVSFMNFGDYANFLKEADNSFISAVDYDKIVGKVFLRQRKPGDVLSLPKRPTKTVKKLMNEKKIPVFIRDRLGVLEDEKGILWVQNIGVSERAALTKTSENVMMLSWQKAPAKEKRKDFS